MLRGKGLRAAAVVIAALVFAPAAFAHHSVITASFSCDGLVSYTATAWSTNSGLPGSRTNTDVRIFETAVNSSALNPIVQVGSGAFSTADNYSFSGSFSVDSSVSSVTLNAKEFAKWGDNSGPSGGTNAESSTTVTRATTGCTPPAPAAAPDRSVPEHRRQPGERPRRDDRGRERQLRHAAAASVPDLDGNQASLPDGMIVDANGTASAAASASARPRRLRPTSARTSTASSRRSRTAWSRTRAGTA